MTIITSTFADDNTSPRQFLLQQVAQLPRTPNNDPHRQVHTSAGNRSADALHADEYVVDAVLDKGRLRYNLRWIGGKAARPEHHGHPAQSIVSGIVHSGWAADYSDRRENFKTDMLRKLFGDGNRSPVMYHVAGGLPLDAYYVDEVNVDGRMRYDLRPVGDRP